MFRKLTAFFVTSLFATQVFAASGTVVEKNGEILDGEIVEVVPGDHVTLKTSKGTRVIAWSDVFSFRLAPSTAAPVVTYVPPAPPPAIDAPSTVESVKGSAFQKRVSLGVYGSLLTGGGDLLRGVGTSTLVGDGRALQLDLGYHFSPAWSFYGGYEYASFDKGSELSREMKSPTGHAAFMGFRAASTSKSKLGVSFEIGAGWRWLRFDGEQTHSVAEGVVPLKIGLGVTVHASDRVRLDLMTATAFGMLTRFDVADGCVNADDCNTIPDSSRTLHGFQSVSLGGTFDL